MAAFQQIDSGAEITIGRVKGQAPSGLVAGGQVECSQPDPIRCPIKTRYGVVEMADNLKNGFLDLVVRQPLQQQLADHPVKRGALGCRYTVVGRSVNPIVGKPAGDHRIPVRVAAVFERGWGRHDQQTRIHSFLERRRDGCDRFVNQLG